MAENSNIGWTDHTWNPWWGCEKVSAECLRCYIDGIMKRAGKEPFNGPIKTSDSTWKQILKWNRLAEKQCERLKIFTCSMSDFFHAGADQWRTDAWELIRHCSTLDFLILTKRPERMAECLPPDWGMGYPNVWLGVTAGVTKSFYRLDELRKIPAIIKFVSAEPLLENLDFRPYLNDLDWIITGCEQAAKGKRRKMEMFWVKNIDRQCQDAGVPHYFKQHYCESDTGIPLIDGLIEGRIPTQNFPTTVRSTRFLAYSHFRNFYGASKNHLTD